jgi:hypothetical protein
MCFTHEGGRFMAPAILVLGLLVGRSIESLPSTLRGIAAVAMLTLALVSGLQLVERFGVDTRSLVRPTEPSDRPSPYEAAGLLFRSDALVVSPATPAGWLNRWLDAHDGPADRPVLWMVGDATAFDVLYPVRYEVAFSHSRLADQLAGRSPALVADWLRRQGCRYLYVNWQEVARLRSSYGFDNSINRNTLRQIGQVYYALDADPAGPPPVPSTQPDSFAISMPEVMERPWLIELSPPPSGPTTQSEKK